MKKILLLALLLASTAHAQTIQFTNLTLRHLMLTNAEWIDGHILHLQYNPLDDRMPLGGTVTVDYQASSNPSNYFGQARAVIPADPDVTISNWIFTDGPHVAWHGFPFIDGDYIIVEPSLTFPTFSEVALSFSVVNGQITSFGAFASEAVPEGNTLWMLCAGLLVALRRNLLRR